MMTNDDKKMPKKCQDFFCKICNFVCSKKSNYDKHVLTRKHKMMTFNDKKMPKNTEEHYSCECGRVYKHRQGLSVHKKKCSYVNESVDDEDETIQPVFVEKDDTLMLLVKQNNDFKDLIISQNQQIVELSKKNQITHNNTITNNNSHNKTFNMQFFLNETCKDAMNITDFVNSLKVSLQDLERVGELGYAEGLSRVLVKGLSDLDITKRPIHCSDAKREILHIKDQDRWEKDNPNQDKLKSAIRNLTNKNIMLLDDWREQNPGCMDYNHRKNILYLRMQSESMGPVDDVNEKRDFGKIIRAVAKSTIIKKDDI